MNQKMRVLLAIVLCMPMMGCYGMEESSNDESSEMQHGARSQEQGLVAGGVESQRCTVALYQTIFPPYNAQKHVGQGAQRMYEPLDLQPLARTLAQVPLDKRVLKAQWERDKKIFPAHLSRNLFSYVLKVATCTREYEDDYVRVLRHISKDLKIDWNKPVWNDNGMWNEHLQNFSGKVHPDNILLPLHIAVAHDLHNVVGLFLRHGSGAFRERDQLPRPLHFAQSVKMCTMFIESGADVNATDAGGYVPLDACAAQAVPFLVQKGADPAAEMTTHLISIPGYEPKPLESSTPLMRSIDSRDANKLQVLLEHAPRHKVVHQLPTLVTLARCLKKEDPACYNVLKKAYPEEVEKLPSKNSLCPIL